MSEKTMKYDGVEDMSLVDFWADEDDVLYPEIRKALRELRAKPRLRRQKFRHGQTQNEDTRFALHYKRPTAQG